MEKHLALTPWPSNNTWLLLMHCPVLALGASEQPWGQCSTLSCPARSPQILAFVQIWRKVNTHTHTHTFAISFARSSPITYRTVKMGLCLVLWQSGFPLQPEVLEAQAPEEPSAEVTRDASRLTAHQAD